MWRIVFLVLLLQGCAAVTIDEPVQEQAEEAVEEPAAEEPTVQQWEEERGIREKVEEIFNIDFGDGKSSDASPLYYIALGDSLTRGVGDEKMEYGYSERLTLALNKWPEISEVELDNRGKNGRRSDQLLKLIERGHYDEELARAELITMTLGGNDVMRVVKKDLFSLDKAMFDAELPKFEARYREVVAQIRARNADVPLILIGFYNPFHIVTDQSTAFETIIDEWNASIQEMAKADVNACFVPVSDLFTTNNELVYHTDFFHPNGNGYDKMATRVIETMQACDIESMSEGRMGFEG